MENSQDGLLFYVKVTENIPNYPSMFCANCVLSIVAWNPIVAVSIKRLLLWSVSSIFMVESNSLKKILLLMCVFTFAFGLTTFEVNSNAPLSTEVC